MFSLSALYWDFNYFLLSMIELYWNDRVKLFLVNKRRINVWLYKSSIEITFYNNLFQAGDS